MTAAEHRVWLPFPPSVNNLYAQGIVKGKVRRFPTKKTRDWKKEAIIRIMAARLPRFTEPVVIKLALTPRDCRGRDADNYNKVVIDCLKEARTLIDDSNQYVKAVISHWENANPTRPGVVVTIRLALANRPQLTSKEWSLLAMIRSEPVFTVPPNHTPSADLRSLLEKGYVTEAPGLFVGGPPQGYRATIEH